MSKNLFTVNNKNINETKQYKIAGNPKLFTYLNCIFGFLFID